MYQTLSTRLRMDIRRELGAAVLSAIQDHLYHKALNYFDPGAGWQTLDILALSEMAHRLRDFALTLDTDHPARAEAQRLSAQIWTDFHRVYDAAMAELPATQNAVAAA